MREPSFWWGEAGLASSLLAPLAMVYGAVADLRLGAPGRRAGVPVVCVGNLTVGGGGKTPTALAVARLLAHAGERPIFLSRGYGGRLAGPLRVDPARHRALDVGDEPLLLARVAPTVIARDRIEGARMAVAGGASVIVMDDGFQNPSLAKDLSLVVVDARRGVGNGRIIPAGPLRASVRSQLARAHALVVIGTSAGAAGVIADARAGDLPVLHARLCPDAGLSATLAGGRVLAFAGIADPQKFFATLAEAGIAVSATRSFPDHHRYTPGEALALCDEADHSGLALVTTEKDLVRLAGDDRLVHLAAHAHALAVTLVFDNEQAFKSLVLEGIAAARAKIDGSEKVHSEKE
jgi:tetraacyldisaccharide 4'-kinase